MQYSSWADVKAAGQLRVLRHAEVALGIHEIDQVVRHALPLFGGRLSRRRVETAVDLERIAADDLAVDPARDLDREFRLAGSGRTDDREQRPPPGARVGHDRGAAALPIAAPL